jgi:hypothetical protein
VAQRLSPNALTALVDALSDVFWAKKDLLAYLRAAVEDERLLGGIDWLGPDYKRDSVSRWITRLMREDPRHRDLLICLMVDVGGMEDFPQLAWLEDADDKIAKAKRAVERLRRYTAPHEAELVAQQAARERIAARRSRAERERAIRRALEGLHGRFLGLAGMDDAQRRGFAFEPFLAELFDLFELAPKRAFRTADEQVDGGFSLDGTHFLLEARWRKRQASRAHLTDFRDKVERRAENTLGLFLSVEGFEPSAVARHSHCGAPLVVMDGADLLAVLEGRIELPDLLRRKHRHASMIGEIYLPVGAFGAAA